MDKLKIIVCCHKADPNICTNEPYFPIQVGKALHPELDLGFQNDNDGDNISDRNNRWSELTALYWGWKNLKDVEYLGLCHYRRYFKYNINANNIDRLLNKHDIIVVKQDNLMFSKKERPRNFIEVTSLEDYYIFMDRLLSTYPEYEKEIIEYFYNSRESYPYTMFVARKELYDDFCNFIFPVLFKMDEVVKPHGYTRQQRLIGYCGEYFLGLYIHCKHLKPLPLPLEFKGFSIDNPQGFTASCKRICKNILRFLYALVEDLIPPQKSIVLPDAVRVGLKADHIEMEYFK